MPLQTCCKTLSRSHPVPVPPQCPCTPSTHVHPPGPIERFWLVRGQQPKQRADTQHTIVGSHPPAGVGAFFKVITSHPPLPCPVPMYFLLFFSCCCLSLLFGRHDPAPASCASSSRLGHDRYPSRCHRSVARPAVSSQRGEAPAPRLPAPLAPPQSTFAYASQGHVEPAAAPFSSLCR